MMMMMSLWQRLNEEEVARALIATTIRLMMSPMLGAACPSKALVADNMHMDR